VVLRQVDRWLGISNALAKRLPDRRDPDRIAHSLESMLRQPHLWLGALLGPPRGNSDKRPCHGQACGRGPELTGPSTVSVDNALASFSDVVGTPRIS